MNRNSLPIFFMVAATRRKPASDVTPGTRANIASAQPWVVKYKYVPIITPKKKSCNLLYLFWQPLKKNITQNATH